MMELSKLCFERVASFLPHGDVVSLSATNRTYHALVSGLSDLWWREKAVDTYGIATEDLPMGEESHEERYRWLEASMHPRLEVSDLAEVRWNSEYWARRLWYVHSVPIDVARDVVGIRVGKIPMHAYEDAVHYVRHPAFLNNLIEGILSKNPVFTSHIARYGGKGWCMANRKELPFDLMGEIESMFTRRLLPMYAMYGSVVVAYLKSLVDSRRFDHLVRMMREFTFTTYDLIDTFVMMSNSRADGDSMIQLHYAILAMGEGIERGDISVYCDRKRIRYLTKEDLYGLAGEYVPGCTAFPSDG